MDLQTYSPIPLRNLFENLDGVIPGSVIEEAELEIREFLLQDRIEGETQFMGSMVDTANDTHLWNRTGRGYFSSNPEAVRRPPCVQIALRRFNTTCRAS